MIISTRRIFESKEIHTITLPKDWLKQLKASPLIYVPNLFSYARVTNPEEALLYANQIFRGETEDRSFMFTNELDHPIFFKSPSGKKLVHAPYPKNVLLLDDAILLRFRPYPSSAHIVFDPKLFIKSCMIHNVVMEPDVFNYLYEFKPEGKHKHRKRKTLSLAR